MRFAYPQIIWLGALLLPLLGAFLVYAWRKKQQLIRQFVQSRLLASLTVGVSQGRQKLKLCLLFVAVVMAFVALARPQWGFDWEEVHQQGIDIVVAIDTSKSMLAQDVVPNRLARARLAVFDLMKLAQSDRLGLIAFAGTAFLQCPLTVDDSAFRQSVEALDANIIPQGGSALAEAIDSAITAFEKSGDNHKVLVLFTDGEDHDSGAVAAADKAAKAGIKIFTVGVGTPEGEMLRVQDERGQSMFLKDDEGNAIRSRLNETLLRQVATSAGGFYLPLVGSNPMEVLYTKGLDVLPKSESTTKLIKNFRERYHWPLGAAILLLIVEFLLPDRRQPGRGETRKTARTLETAGVAALLLVLSPVEMLGSTSSAQKSYELGKFKDSLADYEKLLQRKTNDFRLNFNAGTAAYKAKELSKAQKHFESTLGSPDLTLQQRAYYNLGNTLFQEGEATEEMEERQGAWESAVKNYEGALKLKPDDLDAKNNLEFVRKKLEELKQEQQKQKSDKNKDDQNKDQDQDKDQNQDKKDQDKQDQQQQSKSDEQKKKDEEQQKQQQDSKQNQQQQNQDQQQQEDAKQDQPKPSEEEKKQQQKAAQDDKKEKPEQEPSEASAAAMGQMTMEQAMQFLEAQKQQEKTLIFSPPPDQKHPGKKLKDW